MTMLAVVTGASAGLGEAFAVASKLAERYRHG
jgi:NADP-dependent 3-hydroxy acid dehydrogenase YdfG